MTIVDLLSDLRRRDVKLWADGDKLCYNAPEGVLTPALRAGLAERKAEILEFLQQASVDTSAKLASVPRVSRELDLPLSFQQERLWILDQLEPSNPVYNVAEAVRIGPGLNFEALQRTLDTIVRRHEALRTTYRSVDGNPFQVVGEAHPVKIDRIDLRDWPSSDRDQEVQRILISESRRPFDLSRDRMLRVTLVAVGPDAHVLVLVTHHIACDGWSMGMLFKEFAALYEGYVNGTTPRVAELRVQYADYAFWQRQQLQGEKLAGLIAYWSKQLEGCTTVLELPTDHPRPPVPAYHGAKQSLEIPSSLCQPLKALARRHGATSFMVMLAAFQVLLQRYTRQNDILIGSPIAVYNRFEFEPVIGFWLNTLILRGDLSGDPGFRELLTRVRDTALAAYTHQDLPFDKLVERLPERDPSRNPLFQVMFVMQLQNAPGRALEAGGLAVTPLEIDNQTAKFDLTLSIAEEGEGFVGWIEYDTDLFDADTITRMRGHLETLLKAIVADPEQKLSMLPILTAAERDQILFSWNATRTEYPAESLAHQLFESQVKRTPDAVAAIFEGRCLTYRELDEKANQLAHYLTEHGVGPEVPVGICVERSLDMLVGLLGILKAGGAYVPLDPEYPKERLGFMISDSAVNVLVTQAGLVEGLPEHDASVICLDRDWEAIGRRPVAAPDVAGDPELLAYTIYTSGSTGRPKGVQIPHRALVNFLTSMRREPGLTADDTLLAVTTLSFDIAVLELLLPLTVGATTVIADDEVVLDGARLSALVTAQAITVMQATPSTWRMMLDAGWTGKSTLKVLCGGERLPTELARELTPRCRELWNMYGPTETTIWSSCCKITGAEDTVSVGRPIANTQFYILDAHQQPVPVGVPGELYIGGDGVTRGYLNRETLTEDKFVADPFRGDGGRLYRTGDRARYLPDGQVDLLGRTDYQVKVRGYRIELGEIEAVLEAHEDIADVVVVVHGQDTPDARVVAYVVYAGGTMLTVSEVRQHVRQTLPSYMVPGLVIELDSLPRTPNGKIDRRRLPNPLGEIGAGPVEKVSPETPYEKVIAEVWQALLPETTIGRSDNFFEIGGHSLLSVKATAAIAQRTGQRLDPRLFYFQTLEQLGEVLHGKITAPA